MDQKPQSKNNQNENKSAINIPPAPPAPFVSSPAKNAPSISSVPPAPAQPIPQAPPASNNNSKSIVNMNTQHTGQQFKLASTEVQGPKPPLVNGKSSKFVMIAAILVLIFIAGIGGYYFYAKDNNNQPVNSPVATPKTTPLADKNLDSDKDGLPDAIEKVLGTYMTKADTDGDGYNDLQEIKSGYSPLIAGSAGKYSQRDWDNIKGKIKIEDSEFYKKEFEAPAVSQSPSPMVSLSPAPIESPD